LRSSVATFFSASSSVLGDGLQAFFFDLVLGKGTLVSGSLGVEESVLGGEVNFEDSELSFDGDLVKSFFSWLIFINNGDGFENVQLMKAEDLVSQDFGDLAG
jgi:hypothetical protein